MSTTTVDALIAQLETDLDAAKRTRRLLASGDSAGVGKPKAARSKRRTTTPRTKRTTTTSSAADGRTATSDAWWKRSQSEPGQCDKRLHGDCKGEVHERGCTQDGCKYVARRCEAHGGKKGTGQQLGAHSGRHRAERRHLEQQAAAVGADARRHDRSAPR